MTDIIQRLLTKEYFSDQLMAARSENDANLIDKYRQERKEAAELIQRIKDALGTEENDEALIEVARNAHRAEMELATIKMKLNKCEHESEVFDVMNTIDPNYADTFKD